MKQGEAQPLKSLLVPLVLFVSLLICGQGLAAKLQGSTPARRRWMPIAEAGVQIPSSSAPGDRALAVSAGLALQGTVFLTCAFLWSSRRRRSSSNAKAEELRPEPIPTASGERASATMPPVSP